MVEARIGDTKSQRLYERAKRLMPGGVSSPVRVYAPYPFYTERARGSKIYDVDGREYIDYCMGFGSLLLGHAPSTVIEEVAHQLPRGTLYCTPIEAEVELAELVTKVVPSVEMVRLVNTGAEATMHAIRVARGHTGRSKIVKFEGCYHGAHDAVLVKAGSGAASLGVPTSPGVPEEVTRNTVVLPYNDLTAVEGLMEGVGDQIAAVIVEPVMGNSGPILPAQGFLEAVRKLTRERGALLIFDEVITGFRLALGGAQEYFGVSADLVTLGKVMGGGLPLAAFGGRRDIMEKVSPSGPIYQAGTYSGNPVSVTAGLATLRYLSDNRGTVYPWLEKKGAEMRKTIEDIITDAHAHVVVGGIASLFQIFFTDQPIVDYRSARSSSFDRFGAYFQHLLARGVFIPSHQLETCFLSLAHTQEDIDRTLGSIEAAMKAEASELLRGH